MYSALYQYFIRHRQLAVPGIGVFLLQRSPATADFPNRVIHPPGYNIVLDNSPATSHRDFFDWLAMVFGISEREAVIRFNDFVFEMKQQLRAGDTIRWEGMGILSKGLGEEIRFESRPAMAEEKPVKAEKVIREVADHTVRVGEEERTAGEMREFLGQHDSRKHTWWAWALVLALLLTMFLGWYFSSKGLSIGSTGNTTNVKTEEPAPSYRVPD